MGTHVVRNLPLAVIALFAAACASTQPTATKPEEKAAAETKPAAPAAAAAPAPVAVAATLSYNVVRGDHLWGISSKPTIYGNPYQWPLIFKANRDKIKYADLIEPGQVFSIEKSPSRADIDAAVNHAKTRGEWKLGTLTKTDQAYLAKFGLK